MVSVLCRPVSFGNTNYLYQVDTISFFRISQPDEQCWPKLQGILGPGAATYPIRASYTKHILS